MSAARLRLLFIGNSHIGAPRLAYAADPLRWPDWEIDFLGMLGGNFARLDLVGGALVPTNEKLAAEMQYYNMVRRLEVGGYDAFAIVGGLGWTGMAALCAAHRSLGFPSVMAGATGVQLVGRQFLDAALRERFRKSAAGRLRQRLDSLGKPVLILPEPMPSAECTAARARYAAYVDMVERGDAQFWRDWFRRCAEAELGRAAQVLFWPEAAAISGAYTRPELMRGAMRLTPHRDQPQPETDFAHGNAGYGAMMMDQIMAALPR